MALTPLKTGGRVFDSVRVGVDHVLSDPLKTLKCQGWKACLLRSFFRILRKNLQSDMCLPMSQKSTRTRQQETINKQHTTKNNTHQTTNNKQQTTNNNTPCYNQQHLQSTINNTANHKSYERTVNNFPTVRQRILQRKQSNHNQENVNALQEETKIGMNIKIFETTTLSL